MSAILQIIYAVLQIVFLLMKNKFEKDAERKAARDALKSEATEAIKSRDPSRIVGVADRILRT